MATNSINRILPLGIAALVACVVLASAGIDHALSSIIHNVKLLELSSQSTENLTGLQNGIERLTNELKKREVKVTAMESKRLPSIQDLKTLSRTHRLSIKRMEQQNSRLKAKSSTSIYSVTMEGSVGAIVRFLKAASEQYLFDASSVTVRADNDAGTSIALQLQLEVAN